MGQLGTVCTPLGLERRDYKREKLRIGLTNFLKQFRHVRVETNTDKIIFMPSKPFAQSIQTSTNNCGYFFAKILLSIVYCLFPFFYYSTWAI